jgi:hypothetical protein
VPLGVSWAFSFQYVLPQPPSLGECD